MSKFDDYETKMDDRDCLVDALRGIGCKPVLANNQVEGDHLYGYAGDRRAERAQVILPRKTLTSASNDIGFHRGPDGMFAAVISEFDSQSGFGAEWRAKLDKMYLEKKGIKDLTAQGYTNFERTEVKNANGFVDVHISATPPAARVQPAAQVGFQR
jgi:hypothetical protein